MVYSFNNFLGYLQCAKHGAARCWGTSVGELETFWNALRNEALLAHRWANAGTGKLFL